MMPVAIVGAGITGLTAAFYLRKRNIPVVLYESSGRAGGIIQTVRGDGYIVERGPNTILETCEAVSTLIDDLGLTSRRMYAPPGMKTRYVVRGGRPVALPQSVLSAVRTPLLSLLAKMRLLGEPFISRGNTEDESLSSFVKRRLGSELLDYVIDPFVGGVYAGDPDRLSVTHGFPKLHTLELRYGSLIGGTVLGARERRRAATISRAGAPMFSFDDGLAVLTNALQSELGDAVRLRSAVRTVTPGGQAWRVSTATGTHEHSAVLFCAPAHCMAGINMGSKRREDLNVLCDIYYPPIARVAVGFRAEQITHPLDGFGVLIPRKERMNSLGILFSSSMFPNRAPEGHTLLTAYLGGSRSSDVVDATDTRLVDLALTDMRKLLGISGTPAFENVARIARAIPQYNVGYGNVKDTINRLETKLPGVFIAGSYRDGISVADCIRSGAGACARLFQYLPYV
jgi:oxygen-dependent protoporphyrinogen oxidase